MKLGKKCEFSKVNFRINFLIYNRIGLDSNSIFWLYVMKYVKPPTKFLSYLELFWRIHHCPYLYPLSHYIDLLYVNGASISSVISTAINPAPKVKFSLSKFKFRRNIGSTLFYGSGESISGLSEKVLYFLDAEILSL